MRIRVVAPPAVAVLGDLECLGGNGGRLVRACNCPPPKKEGQKLSEEHVDKSDLRSTRSIEEDVDTSGGLREEAGGSQMITKDRVEAVAALNRRCITDI